MKSWNWMLIAWYLIPILGWLSIMFFVLENVTVGWWLLLATALWIFVCIVWGLLSTRDRDIKIYQDEIINRKVGER